LSLFFGVDRLLAPAIALINVIGNALAVFVIAKWEGLYDPARFEDYLVQQAQGHIEASGLETVPPSRHG
jgi:aerobic C4-dicarboxylate transport protein